jgi:hypothetical protein
LSTLTNKLNLVKPEKTDPADITAINENWDKLDAHTHESFDYDVSMDGHKITNVAEPESRNDVATRGFVEDFSIEGSTYVAVDENNDGNVVLRPYVPVVDDAADYVVEQGMVDGWTYRKWNSGIAEMWLYTYATETADWDDTLIVSNNVLPFNLIRDDGVHHPVLNVSGMHYQHAQCYITMANVTSNSNGDLVASAYLKCLNTDNITGDAWFNFYVMGCWK